MKQIYLDNNATHAMLPQAREAMLAWMGVPCNPSSSHQYGQRARSAVEHARRQIAEALNRPVAGIIFTSGATEANHHAAFLLSRSGAKSVACSNLEHPCVQGAISAFDLQRVLIEVNTNGQIQPNLPPSDAVACMAANHETGVIQPAVDHHRLWVDATAGFGKMKPNWSDAEMVICSSHKIGGPMGVGIISLKNGDPSPAFFSGGGQERARRSGTSNVPAIIGFGVAAEEASKHLQTITLRWQELRLLLEEGLVAMGARIAGHSVARVANTTCAVFDDLQGETLVAALDLAGFAISYGSACSSGSLRASPALTAMGDPNPQGAIRISLGRSTTEQEIEAFLAAMPAVLSGQRLAAEFAL